MKNTKFTLEEARQFKKDICDAFEIAFLIFDKKKKELRERCPHSISFSPDPSRNNDSSWDCSICRSSWKSYPNEK